MPVTKHSAQANRGVEIGMLGKKLGYISLDRLRQWRALRCPLQTVTNFRS
jgi:hypothetical protein